MIDNDPKLHKEFYELILEWLRRRQPKTPDQYRATNFRERFFFLPLERIAQMVAMDLEQRFREIEGGKPDHKEVAKDLVMHIHNEWLEPEFRRRS